MGPALAGSNIYVTLIPVYSAREGPMNVEQEIFADAFTGLQIGLGALVEWEEQLRFGDIQSVVCICIVSYHTFTY